MKVINQIYCQYIKFWISNEKLILSQDKNLIIIDTHGAKQLIEILKEFVNEND
jgi:hypothetical protein